MMCLFTQAGGQHFSGALNRPGTSGGVDGVLEAHLQHVASAGRKLQAKVEEQEEIIEVNCHGWNMLLFFLKFFVWCWFHFKCHLYFLYFWGGDFISAVLFVEVCKPASKGPYPMCQNPRLQNQGSEKVGKSSWNLA